MRSYSGKQISRPHPATCGSRIAHSRSVQSTLNRALRGRSQQHANRALWFPSRRGLRCIFEGLQSTSHQYSAEAFKKYGEVSSQSAVSSDG